MCRLGLVERYVPWVVLHTVEVYSPPLPPPLSVIVPVLALGWVVGAIDEHNAFMFRTRNATTEQALQGVLR